MSAFRYLPCELHCHSVHSDGAFTVAQLARAGAEEGLKLLALTDHNTDSGCDFIANDEVARTIPIVPGIEWTTDYGHLLVLGARKYVDWRTAAPGNIDEKLAEIRDAGGVCGIAHPFREGFPVCCGCNFEFEPERFDLVDFVEIWSEPDPLAKAYNARSIAWWISLLDRGFRIAATYGRDWHSRRDGRGSPARTYLGFRGTEATVAGALAALRDGRSIVSMGSAATFELALAGSGGDEPAGALGAASAGVGDRVDWLGRASAVDISISARLEEPWPSDGTRGEARYFAVLGRGGEILWEGPASPEGQPAVSGRLTCNSPYLRLELRGDYRGEERALALTSPIWLTKG
ncbi:MAG: CehA/McbA family metallohydrolase [Spirochaetaceae bacterium]|nr:CehA/McbA family metallohydrolase [Spirochaetaceae bacterium]